MPANPPQSGFTLIELLIVVAIIAILAAIAVPNFLEAQTRAKVARAKSDLRAMATGLEAYRVDNNAYPYVSDDEAGEWNMPAGFPANQFCGGLTTPIAYITSALKDPFVLDPAIGGSGRLPRGALILLHYERCGFGFDENGVAYDDNGSGRRAVHVPPDAMGGIWGTCDPGDPDAIETTDLGLVPTDYVLFSIGPDRTHRVYNPDGTVQTKSRWSVLNYYDPSNGTISQGNIVRFPGGQTIP